MRLGCFFILLLLAPPIAASNGEIFAHPLYKRALEKFEAGEFEDSHRLFKELDGLYPDNPTILNNLGVASAKVGRIEAAEKLFERALTVNQGVAISYRNLRKIYNRRAAETYRRALLLEPEQTPPLEVQLITPSSVPAAPADLVSAAETVLGDNRIEKPAVDEPDDAQSVGDGAVREAVVKFVRQWAQAWEGQDAGAYFSHYMRDYQPRPAVSHQQWKRKRTERLTAPQFISVETSNFRINEKDGDYDVFFRQVYRSNFLKSTVIKQLRLRKDQEAWKIVRERVAERK